MILCDPVPLGVSGTLTIPLAQYVARLGRKPDRADVLLDEADRITYVARRLSEAIDRPLGSPGSAGLARSVLASFQDVDLMLLFAEKAMETLRDGKIHNRTTVSPNDPHAVVLFVAWSGTHLEVMSDRFGNYLVPLFATAKRIVLRGIQIDGFLQIDAYLRDRPDASNPGRRLDEVFEIDLEYSYLPGSALGCTSEAATRLPRAIVLNPDLCSPEELQSVRKLIS
jgi:hypothetical protein